MPQNKMIVTRHTPDLEEAIRFIQGYLITKTPGVHISQTDAIRFAIFSMREKIQSEPLQEN